MNTQDTEEVIDYAFNTWALLYADMRDNILKSFLKFILDEVGDEYFLSPASRGAHHAYEGGLAFHSMTAAELGGTIADHYNEIGIKVNRDLVVAGIILHDIGKIKCYKPFKGKRTVKYHGKEVEMEDGYEYTSVSSLHHHIPIGFAMVQQLAEIFNDSRDKEEHKIGEKKLNKLLHIILSHHGRRSWSSPVIPQFVEAYIVHAVEMMDAYVEKYDRGDKVSSIYD